MTGNTVLSGLKNQQNSSSSQGQPSGLSFAIRLTGYEGKYFVGNRLDTGEEVKVCLREANNTSSDATKIRPEIEDYQNTRSKRYVVVGEAVLQFDRVYHDKENMYSAYWPNVINKNKAYARAAMLFSSVEFVDSQSSTYVKVRVIKANDAKVFTSVPEFDDFLGKTLAPNFPYHKPFAVVRLIERDANGDVVDVVALTVSPKYEEVVVDENIKEYRPMSSEESLDQFRERHCQGDNSLYNYIGHSAVQVEVIPGTVFRAGPDTNQKLVKMPEGILKPFKAAYRIDRDGLDVRDNLGYIPTNLGIKKSENRGDYFLSFVKPNDFSYQALDLKDIPTPNYSK